MSSPSEDFISSFHSLTGTTIGERRKNLFLLLHLTRQHLQQSSGAYLDLSLLEPKTPLEEVFKVDVLLFFRRIPDLLEVLKSEKPALIKKVLRATPWFLEQAFENRSGDQIVAQIFPYVSYNVKLKLANKMAGCLKNQHQADEAFHAIREKYGLNLATKMLPACSPEVIVTTFRNFNVKVPPRTMLMIVRKYPEVSTKIFGSLKSGSGRKSIGVVYKKVFAYLAKSNHSDFMRLYGKFEPTLRLGWRATDRFIRANERTSILDNANALSKVLQTRQCFKTLNQDFPAFYQKLLPSSIIDFSGSLTFLLLLLEKLPPSVDHHITLLEEAFRKTYKIDLIRHPSYFSHELLGMQPVARRRDLVYTSAMPMSKTAWSCYLPIDRSIPYLKKRISVSSDFEYRAKIANRLVQTCMMNDDTQALTEVCRYMVEKHCNDHIHVRTSFLFAVKLAYDLETLNEDQWSSINELMDTIEVDFKRFDLMEEFMAGFIHYRLLKGYDVMDQMAKYLTSLACRYNLLKEHPNFEKHCLLLAGELIPQIFSYPAIRVKHIYFLNSLVNWNKRHSKDEISLFDYPDAVETFKGALEGRVDNVSTEKIIEYFLRYKKPISNDLLVLCLAKINFNSFGRGIANWLMWYKPLLVANNIKSVLKLLLMTNNQHFFWRQARNFTHLDIPKAIVLTCLDAFAINELSERDNLRRRNAATALSYLMNSKDFVSLSFVDYPLSDTTTKPKSRSYKQKLQYKQQKGIVTNLKHLVPPSLAFFGLRRFCKGDFLKPSLVSLYSVCDNVNEDKLRLFLTQLSRGAVSVRKHSVHLALRALDRTLTHDVFSKFMGEHNSSTRSMVNANLQDPSYVLWKLLKSNVEKPDEDHDQVIQMQAEIESVPFDERLRYVMLGWEIMDEQPDNLMDISIPTQKQILLRALPITTIQELDQKFVLAVVRKHFCQFDERHKLIGNFNSFVCKILIYCPSQTEQEQRVDLVVDTLRSHMSEPRRRCVIDQFLRDFCDEFLKKRRQSSKLLSTFATRWSLAVKPEKAFGQYVYLQLTLLFLDPVDRDWSTRAIGKSLARFCDSLAETYGTSVVGVLCDVLPPFIPRYCAGSAPNVTEEENRYILIEGILQTSSSTGCAMVAISLLGYNYPGTQPKHDEIVRMLNELDNPVVQIHLNHHLYRM